MNYKIGKKKIGSYFIILVLMFMLLPLEVYIVNSQPVEETRRIIVIEIYLSSTETKTKEFIVIPNEEKEKMGSVSGASGGIGGFPLPYQFESTGDKDYLTQPTWFYDPLSNWIDEELAHDWNNLTFAVTYISGDGNDLDLTTFNTTDNSGEDITYLDLYIRADWLFTGNDYVVVKWFVGATQGTGTFTMNAGNSGDDQIISFENVAEPNDATWSWADVGNIKFKFDMERIGGGDLEYLRIDETWSWIDIEEGVGDTTDPDIDSPVDQDVEFGATGNSITWTVGDANPNNYIIYRNGSNVENGAWTNGTLDADSGELDGLAIGFYNLTCWVDDDTGNWAKDEVIFQVYDSTYPILDSPSDDSYSEGSTGNTITWTATDLLPDNFICYQNASEYDTGSWTSGVGIVIDIDGFAIGFYNFSMIVYDTSNLYDTDYVIIQVIDTTYPVLDNPSDDSYSEGSTSNTITWTATDTNPDNFICYQNGSEHDTGSWTSGVGIVIDIDGFAIGFYNFSMIVFDVHLNYDYDYVIIQVIDTTYPILDSPSDDSYSEGSTSNTITWTATDTNPDNFICYRNGSEHDTGSWTSGVGIVIDIDGFAIGFYNFSMIVYDIHLNYDTDYVIIQVIDTTFPVLDSPSDDSYSEGSTSNTITWTATDLNPDNFICYQNASEYDTGSWTSGVGIVIDIDGFAIGFYNFSIIVFDVHLNYDYDYVIIQVIDTTYPVLDSPSDDTYSEGTTSNTITWTATDLNPDNFICYQNASEYDTGSWTSGVGIVIDIDGFAIGFYNFSMIVYDIHNNYDYDYVIIQVIDTTYPILDSPSDDSYPVGDTGNTITWTATDTNPDNFICYRNGSEHDTGSWTSGIGIIIDIDGFGIGFYNFSMIVFDIHLNYDYDYVIIQVTEVDDTNPDLDSPSDDSYEMGSTSNTIVWTAGDKNPDNYTCYRNGTEHDSGLWTNGTIIIDIDGFGLGFYNFTLLIHDTSDNFAVDTVIIQVIDTTYPILDSPSDDSYSEGSTSNTITWTATDLNPDNFICYQNGSEHDTGSWTSGVGIVIDIDGFAIGFYNFSIIVYDTGNLYDVDYVIIQVIDTTYPVLDSPSDDSYSEGSTSNIITWTATDLNPDNFICYQNGSEYDTGSWSSGVGIVIDIDGFAIGFYNFSMIVFDIHLNYDYDYVIIQVIDTTYPVLDSPSDDSYSEGTTSNTITWTATDLNPDNFICYRNGSEHDTGLWTSGVGIVIDIDGFAIGFYNFSMIVYDIHNNYDYDYVIIQVIDTTNPVLDSPSDDSYSEGSTSNIITWTATDTNPDNFICYQNASEYDTGSWTSGVGIVIDIDGFAIGFYNFSMIVFDIHLNYDYDYVIIQVIDTTYPILDSPSDDSYSEGSTSNTITWTATDLNPDNFICYRNGSEHDTGSWTSGVGIVIDIDGFAIGFYNFSMIVYDIHNNYDYDYVIIQVIDTTYPVLDSPSDDTYNWGSTGNTITWTATDLNPDNFICYQNGSEHDTGSWSSGVGIVIDIDGFAIGFYNFSMIVYDVHLNYDYDYVIIQVIVVVDNDDPTITSPDNIEFAEFQIGYNITWNATDVNPHLFVIYRNDSNIQSGSYTNDTNIVIGLNGLSDGYYNYTCFVNDTASNFVVDLVWVNVIDVPVTYGWFQWLLLHPEDYIGGIFLFVFLGGLVIFILLRRRRRF